MIERTKKTPASSLRTFAMLGVSFLFLMSTLAITPKAAASPVQGYVDMVWEVACNPINNADPAPLPNPNAVRDCPTLDWALGLAQHPCGNQPCVQDCDSGTGYVVDSENACVTLANCGPGQTGYVVDGKRACVNNLGYTGPCDSGQTGYVVDGVRECTTLGRTGPCSSGQVGYEVDGTTVCRTTPTVCPAGSVGVQPNCTPLPQTCPPGKVGSPPNCVDPGGVGGPGGVGVPSVPNCPIVAGVSCPPAQIPLPNPAFVEYDSFHGLVLFNPAPAPGATFRVIVGGLPNNAGSVELYGDGSLIDRVYVGLLVGPSTKNDGVEFDNVPLLASDNYQLNVVDGSNSDIATSGTLRLWTDVRQYINTPGVKGPASPSNGTNNPGNGTASPDPGNPTPSCNPGPAGSTWAQEGTWDGAYISDHTNTLSENDGGLTDMAFARPWTWGYANGCGYSQVGPAHPWGMADGHEGKSSLQGTGSYNFGYAVSYEGGGRDMTWTCGSLGACGMVGYDIRASNARSFMNTPSKGAPTWEGTWGVSIPSASGTPPSLWAHVALDSLSTAVSGWPGAFITALGYAVPNQILDMDSNNWDPITQAIDGSAGGGILIHPSVSGQQVVSGNNAWRFSAGGGSFTWDIESAVDMAASFQACVGCAPAGNSYTAWTHEHHQAEIIVHQ